MSADAGKIFRRYLSAGVINALATAEAAGLNATDYYALNLLDLSGPLTSGDLAVGTGLTTGATTRLIDRLEKGGLVRRVPDPSDRRKVIVEPMARPDGLEQLLAGTRRRLGEVFDGMAEGDREVLFRYFTQAADAYQTATQELRHPQTPPPL
ncbi:MarR family winged helix-turn-helix transcriptional regulator [Nonomuraea endophytica]|uniref:DNA-binding MarR family transcriptional regulator n=1 Tax=Nonomuraea endophytica TaxID=714136 RepID=A0A7W8AGB4_9ACTN|nr:MarR family transcriptional regulator [Nonomuraea endophytica]MBB5085234.1 DNA-binding MarR family transcriptional regulator [Nonomuraea endophytica]